MNISRLFILASASILLFGAGCSNAPSTSQSAPIQPSAQQAPSAPLKTDAVIISSFAFQPNSLKVKVGTAVSWRNEDGASHTIVGDHNEFMSDALPTKATFTFTFTKSGTYTYHCSLHPSMKGTIVVE